MCACGRRVHARGMCPACYSRWWKQEHGHPKYTRDRPAHTIDPFVIECVLNGTRMTTNIAEKRALVAEFTRRGLQASVIADRLDITARSVHRLRGGVS